MAWPWQGVSKAACAREPALRMPVAAGQYERAGLHQAADRIEIANATLIPMQSQISISPRSWKPGKLDAVTADDQGINNRVGGNWGLADFLQDRYGCAGVDSQAKK